MKFLMEKDGIRQEVVSQSDVARLKSLGYKLVKEVPAEPVEPVEAVIEIEPSPEAKNKAAIEEVNKPKKAGK